MRRLWLDLGGVCRGIPLTTSRALSQCHCAISSVYPRLMVHEASSDALCLSEGVGASRTLANPDPWPENPCIDSAGLGFRRARIWANLRRFVFLATFGDFEKMPRTLESILPRDKNNFDLIRMFAAMSVILGHSFALYPTGGWRDPLGQVFEFTYSGSVAVDIFFFLSGILVAASFCQSRSLVRYVVMRASRILPGLTVCLLFTVLVVGTLVTTKTTADYFGADETRWYVLKNIQLQKMVNRLPGVFEFNHYRLSINGSLWTLPIEIRCYAMVFLFGVIGGFRNAKWSVLLALLLAALAFVYTDTFRIFRVYDEINIRLPLIFCLGMLCYAHRSSIRIDWRVSFVALIVALSFRSTLIGVAASYLFFINTVLVLGGADFLRRVKSPGDYSFGIYVYGWVIQQCVASRFPELESYPSLLLTLPLSVVAGVLSWHFIELPAMNLARHLLDQYEIKRGLKCSSV